MRDKIAGVLVEYFDLQLGNVPDAADEIMGLLRQEGQSIRWCTEHDAQVWDTLAEPEDQVCHYFEGKPVLKYHNDFCEVADALVLLPEEDG